MTSSVCPTSMTCWLGRTKNHNGWVVFTLNSTLPLEVFVTRKTYSSQNINDRWWLAKSVANRCTVTILKLIASSYHFGRSTLLKGEDEGFRRQNRDLEWWEVALSWTVTNNSMENRVCRHDGAYQSFRHRYKLLLDFRVDISQASSKCGTPVHSSSRNEIWREYMLWWY